MRTSRSSGSSSPSPSRRRFDQAALISEPVARRLFRADRRASRIYLRSDPDRVAAVAAVLPFTASPAAPEAVQVRRPSEILAARATARTAFVGLFLALGGVALLVGGVGIANIMVISVVERRAEIGLRRALGARAVHVAVQFFLEALLLSAAGGALGVALGGLVTVVTSGVQHATVQVPATAVLLGLAAPLLGGAVAGAYPAVRAGRVPPAEALRGG